jgi:small-conductance mechanosensitive channel
MSMNQRIAAVVLALLLAGAAYGLFRTGQASGPPSVNSSDMNPDAPGTQSVAIDQSALSTAQRMAALASGDDEQVLAKEALRLGDHEVDLAFASALRNAAEHPPVLSAEAQDLKTRVAEADSALEHDKAEIARLTALEAKAQGAKKASASDELEIAKAQLELDQDEVDDVRQDLMRAGGDPQGRIQAMVQEHEAAMKEVPGLSADNAKASQAGGVVHRLSQWWELRRNRLLLEQARQSSLAAAAGLSGKHDALVATFGAKKSSTGVVNEKTNVSEVPAEHAAGPKVSAGKPVARSHEQAVVVVKVTKERSAQQNELATLDKRVQAYQDLAGVYDQWAGVVAGKQSTTLRRAIWGGTIILLILLVAIFFSSWLEQLLGRLPVARRQLDTLRAVVRLTLQIFAVLLTLLVIFGPPGQLGTFLGLAGAGLTIALKDFIVSFVGWFVLMGRNGIRLGDWVEINGVTGEVVELGMFHTVLLETGNWTDSGHPTGRRVTFTNSFAIEGHYFNFSTSGQWMWDELQISLPAGQDPFPIVDAIQKKVKEATAETAALAEKEWQHAARSRDMSVLSAAPAINVRPVIGGIELAVRYITRASERYQLRSKLYHVAMDLLAGKEFPAPDGTPGATVEPGASGAAAAAVKITAPELPEPTPTKT